MAGKPHRGRKAGRKADKRKQATKKKGTAGGGAEALDAGISGPAGGGKSPHLASKGKAAKARARTAEKEQRRLHVPGADWLPLLQLPLLPAANPSRTCQNHAATAYTSAQHS